MRRPIIEVENVSKRYRLGQFNARTLREEAERLFRWRRSNGKANGASGGWVDESEFWALKDVPFSVQPGEVIGIIGRNGAGKSTLLKILSRITEPTSGQIRIRGRVASLLEVGTGFHPELTGRENIFLNGAILGMTRSGIKAKFDEIVAFAEADRFLDTPVKRYSSGMYVRLAFAVAAHLEPEILVVDEVLAVGDAAFQKKCLGKMREVSANIGRTVLFVSHNMGSVRELCSRAILLEAGQVKCDGKAAQVVESYFSVVGAASEIDLGALKHFGPQRWSRLRKLCLFNGEGTPSTTFIMNKALVARIQVEITEHAEKLEVGLKISSRYGVPVHYFTSSWEGLSPNLKPGLYWFEMRVPELALFPGTYIIGLWASKGRGWSDCNVQEVTSILVLKADVTGYSTRMEEYTLSGSEVYARSEWKLLSTEGQ